MDADTAPPSTLAAAWPLFALRIQSERLVMRLPTDDEISALIDLANAGIHPPDAMPFGIAWTRVPSPEFERAFVQHHWQARASFRPDEWALHLAVWHEDRPIGAQSLMATQFRVHRSVNTGSWLGRSFQGRGFGKDMRGAVLAFAFDGLGAQVAETEAFLDNAASNGVSRSLGYAPDGRGRLAPEGVSRETQRFAMTAEGWRARPRPTVTIDGLDACRDMFGT